MAVDEASVEGRYVQRETAPCLVTRLLHGAAAIDPVALAAFLYRSTRRGTDYRWADLGRHTPDWDGRTRMIAGFVGPGSRVVEFGCGRRVLETALPDGCVYIPSDIVARGPDTWVCDLNRRPLPAIPDEVDVAIFSGVLEYVFDLPVVLRWLSTSNVRIIIASYGCVRPSGLSRLFDTVNRLRFGWVNCYSENELASVFETASYRVDQCGHWRDQFVGRFVKASGG